MTLTLDKLSEMGAFTGAPVEREIAWKANGKEHKAKVFVKKLSYETAVQDIYQIGKGGNNVAGRIAHSICNEKGEPIFTVEDITGEADPERGAFTDSLTMALLGAIGEVNNLGNES